MILDTSELWIPRPLPIRPDLYIHRETGTPLRWTFTVEVMDEIPSRGCVFTWRSDQPGAVYQTAPEENPAELFLHRFSGINQVTGLPNAFELRDLVIANAVR